MIMLLCLNVLQKTNKSLFDKLRHDNKSRIHCHEYLLGCL